MALGSVFPVVYEDSIHLIGKANVGAYHSHYIPVKSLNGSIISYAALKEGDIPLYDEFVVFDAASILPRFVVYYDIVTKE